MRKNILIAALFGLAAPLASLQAGEKIDFEKEIYPFVKSGCVICHRPPYEDERGRMRKPKNDMILATKEGMLSEYELDSGETAPVLVPGKPKETRMLQVTKLPINDDLHFPPEGKAPQWTEAEQELFAKWVKQGADFGDWEEDPNPNEGLDWDGEEKEPGTIESHQDSESGEDSESEQDSDELESLDDLEGFGDSEE